MKFDKLDGIIPYVTGGKQKILSMQPYNAVTLRLPGRHADQTTPVGGDFVVCVEDSNMGWVQHQFTHSDIFMDLERKNNSDPETTSFLMRQYLNIVANGDDPEKISVGDSFNYPDSLHPQTFLYAVQALAIAEHRRFERFESRHGGRFLPFRFGAGIVEGLWTATDAAAVQRRGRPGCEMLERTRGLPILTKELMDK